MRDSSEHHNTWMVFLLAETWQKKVSSLLSYSFCPGVFVPGLLLYQKGHICSNLAEVSSPLARVSSEVNLPRVSWEGVGSLLGSWRATACMLLARDIHVPIFENTLVSFSLPPCAVTGARWETVRVIFVMRSASAVDVASLR